MKIAAITCENKAFKISAFQQILINKHETLSYLSES